MTPYKIVLVDDHTMFLNGLESLLRNLNDATLTAMYTDPVVALERLETDAPDLVITDISMPGINGISLLKKIRSSHPTIAVMVLSMHNEAAMVKTVLKENPQGYLLKNTDQDELFLAIRTIREGQRYYSPAVQAVLIDDLQGVTPPQASIIPVLSPREKDVLLLIVAECTTQEIAERLFLSVNTVETYRQNLLRKLEAKNSAGIVARAYQYGLV
ncbi:MULTISPECIES: response regulator [unclassified Flavobacterium]|uniref:response regulator n=1 Tax=unclassified Flavobacterium TaxID=196869 RepID=UPI00361A2FCB